MKGKLILLLFPTILLGGWAATEKYWIIEEHTGYSLFYTQTDQQNTEEYKRMVEAGMSSVASFFNKPYPQQVDIYVHPDRHSLDSTWQKDWNMPDFKSECWMVASGIATRLDMISPYQWERVACEHTYADKEKTQKLITHELVHVYHGQINASHDFSNIEGIDWFVEGLATYASGQCDSVRISEVKKANSENKIPNELDNLWTGKLKYGLSGSMVMFIDFKYGRATLIELLPLNKKVQILSKLNITESDLIVEWKRYISS